MELTAGFFQAVWAPALVPLQDVSHTDSMPRMGAHPWAPERESLRARRCRRDPREWMLSWEHPEAFRSEVKSRMRKSLSKTCCIACGTPLQAVCHPGWQEGLGRMGTCICTAESLLCSSYHNVVACCYNVAYTQHNMFLVLKKIKIKKKREKIFRNEAFSGNT